MLCRAVLLEMMFKSTLHISPIIYVTLRVSNWGFYCVGILFSQPTILSFLSQKSLPCTVGNAGFYLHILPGNFFFWRENRSGKSWIPASPLQKWFFHLWLLCICRPAAAHSYNQGHMTGPHPSYPQTYGPPPSMQQVTNQMTGMQITSGPPTPAGPGYGTFKWILLEWYVI